MEWWKMRTAFKHRVLKTLNKRMIKVAYIGTLFSLKDKRIKDHKQRKFIDSL